jgi:transmembrane sensor
MEEPVTALGGMLHEVATTQRETLARAHVSAQVRARSHKKRPLARRFAERLPRARFALPTLAAVGALAIWWGTREAPLSFAISASADGASRVGHGERAGKAGAWLQAPPDRGLPIRFSDGSLVALDRGARVQVTALEVRGATLEIQEGRAEVDVRHRSHTHWRLRAGPFEVAVTGTHFSIDWENGSETLTVVMAEGTVEVRRGHLAGGSSIVVAAGQRFHATAREPRWSLAAATSPEVAGVGPASGSIATSAVAPPEAPAATAIPSEAPPEATTLPSVRNGGASPASASRSWQALARAGRYQEALRTVERSGFNRACGRLGPEDLVQLGDAARLARNPARAERAYRMARRRFPAIDRPAFALGLVAFEQRRDFRTAAHWFETYVRQYPNGQLAREAVGREMESWHRAGDEGRAREAAHAYLGQAPTGPYARLARQIAAP